MSVATLAKLNESAIEVAELTLTPGVTHEQMERAKHHYYAASWNHKQALRNPSEWNLEAEAGV